MTKKTIRGYSKKQDIDDLTLDAAISKLNQLRVDHGGDALVEFTVDYEGDTDFYVRFDRLETDDEYSRRTIGENCEKEAQRQRELKLLAELKAKYEKEV